MTEPIFKLKLEIASATEEAASSNQPTAYNWVDYSIIDLPAAKNTTKEVSPAARQMFTIVEADKS